MTFRSRLAKWMLLSGLLLAVTGAVLVVKGEIDRAQDAARFRESQAVLKAGIEAFSGKIPTNPAPTFGSDTPANNGLPGDFENIRAIARIEITSIDLDVAVVRYGRYADLELGLGWMPASTALGDTGSSIVLGHRSLFGSPLRDMDDVAIGDVIQVTLKDGTSSNYIVRMTTVRRPSDSYLDLVKGVDVPRLLLVTCHPEDSTEFRLLVVADVVSKV